MFYTYILENQKNALYIGQTGNIEQRLEWHNSGKSFYTKNKGPWKLVYKKDFVTRAEAVNFERCLKSLKSSKYIRENIIH